MQTENTYVETDLGNIALNPRGEYDAETLYEYLDTVSYRGGSYVCLAELSKTINNIAPEEGKNTEHWQMLTLPGGLTSDYIAMHDDVVNKAKQVETSRAAVELSQQEVEDAQADVSQMRQDTQEAAEEAASSRDSAAGYAQSAETSRTAAKESEDNINAQVVGFDAHVTEKTSAAESAITEARQTAVNTVSVKQDDAVQTVTGEGNKQVKNVGDAGTEQVGKVKSAGTSAVSAVNTASGTAVDAVKAQQTASTKAVTDEGVKQVTAVKAAGTAQVNTVNSAGKAQIEAVGDVGKTQSVNITESAAKELIKMQNITSKFEANANNLLAMFGLLAYTDKVYSVDIPLWETTQGGTCIKSDDNAGLVALPSTAVEHRQNDYEELPWFKTIDVNAVVDDNGIKKITAVKGDNDFSESGSADVFVCGLAFYEKWSDLGNGYMRYSRCFTPREGYELNKLAYNLDGTKNPFFLIAKYPLVTGDDGLLHSQPNKRCAFRTSDSTTEAISMNDSIAHMKKRGKYYSLATFLDNGYIQTTWLLMFGDINSDETMTGCTGNSFQFVASIESDELHTYFPVTNSQASSIEIGSYVSVGHEYMSDSSRSNDRYDKRIHEIAFDVKVLKIETLDDNNKAVYLDCDAFSTVHQEFGDTQLRCIMSSMHWRTGFNKDVKGRTGSPCPTVAGLTNRRYPIIFQGIEMQLGVYEVMAGFDIVTSDGTHEIYGLSDATKAVTNPKQSQAGHTKLSSITITNKSVWNYITHLNFESGYLCAASCGESGSGSSKGCGDAVYPSGNAGETRELRSFGGLWSGGACGLFCLYLNCGLGGFWWDIGGRLSVNAVLQEG